MNSADIVSDKQIADSLASLGFDQSVGSGRLMLAELLVKAGAGCRNSHTEELFLSGFAVLKRDRTPNAKGRRFLMAMFYASSSCRPESFELMRLFRRAR